MDTDRDETLTLEEVQAFMRGAGKSAPKEHELIVGASGASTIRSDRVFNQVFFYNESRETTSERMARTVYAEPLR